VKRGGPSFGENVLLLSICPSGVKGEKRGLRGIGANLGVTGPEKRGTVWQNLK